MNGSNHYLEQRLQNKARYCLYLMHENKMCSNESGTWQQLQLPSSARLKRVSIAGLISILYTGRDINISSRLLKAVLSNSGDIAMRVKVFSSYVRLITLPPNIYFELARHILGSNPAKQGVILWNAPWQTISFFTKRNPPVTRDSADLKIQNMISNSVDCIMQA